MTEPLFVACLTPTRGLARSAHGANMVLLRTNCLLLAACFALSASAALAAPKAPPADFKFDKMPGMATDIGVGADGSVWVIGDNKVAGGFGIYRWNGKDNWTP